MTHTGISRDVVINEVILNKALNEINVLTDLLKGIGFRISKSFEQLSKLQAVYDDNLVCFYTLYYNTDNAIGSCRVYTINSNTILVASTLIRHFLTEEVVSQLLLLGYEETSSGPFLDYEVTVNG